MSIFELILKPDKLNNIIHSSTVESLALINMLTKISNSPFLLKAVADKVRSARNEDSSTVKKAVVLESVKLLPAGAQANDFSLSGMSFRTV
jgi:DNA repair and recombination protein RAD54B